MTSRIHAEDVSEVPAWGFFEFHFAKERLRHYVNACNGDHTQALALYQRNIELGAAFWESLGYLEIALRNTIDRQLAARHRRKNRTGIWIHDEYGEFGRSRTGGDNRYPFSDVVKASGRIQGNQKPVVSGQIISELSFGFWHNMVSNSRTALWPDVASGFPHAPDRNQARVSEPVDRLRRFRNRIGHHHRIWSEDVAGRQADILLIATYIDPRLAHWIESASRVPALLKNTPSELLKHKTLPQRPRKD